MLRRKKNVENENVTFVAGASPDGNPVVALNPVGKNEKTVIGEHIHIEGNIRGEESLLIEGSMKGNIHMPKHSVQMGATGRFEGEIHALNVSIGGRMVGKINSIEKVEITKDADFQGEIKTKTLALEDGAYFKGSIELDREPHHKTEPELKTVELDLPGWDPKPPLAPLDEPGKND
jgi:cytoskeletal protein CcmA (bactofilin family)